MCKIDEVTCCREEETIGFREEQWGQSTKALAKVGYERGAFVSFDLVDSVEVLLRSATDALCVYISKNFYINKEKKSMEHVVQFGINIDDEAIKNAVNKSAERAIIERINKDVRKHIFEEDCYGRQTDRPTYFLERKIEEFLDKNRDTILEKASDKLADKLSKTKKARELLDNINNK